MLSGIVYVHVTACALVDAPGAYGPYKTPYNLCRRLPSLVREGGLPVDPLGIGTTRPHRGRSRCSTRMRC
ncbi:MAG: hypothetical protein F4218_09975 [Synechococcus sp. SB0677_bin_5]|nr:hypothetical protein [Synechococcus sp. SB0677_bin_5]